LVGKSRGKWFLFLAIWGFFSLGRKRYLRVEKVNFTMPDTKTNNKPKNNDSSDALKEASQIALELGEKNNSNVPQTASANTETKQVVEEKLLPAPKKVVVVKKKVVKKVVAKKSAKPVVKSKLSKKVDDSKTSLVDVAKEESEEEAVASIIESDSPPEEEKFVLKNPLSPEKSNGGLIELAGGVAMVLIGLEIVVIFLILIYTLFFK
jgi:hypothetical protein